MPLGRRNGILYPLDFLCDHAGTIAPAVKAIPADRIPPPYHALLVHEDEMTQTLERHVGGSVVLRALSSVRKAPWYFRHVLLSEEASGRPVVMGAVGIRVDRFKPRIRTQIFREEVPLGRILREAGIEYKSRPQVFFEVTPTPEIMGIFWMPEPRTLYGRQTEMTLQGARIGNIVEILPLV